MDYDDRYRKAMMYLLHEIIGPGKMRYGPGRGQNCTNFLGIQSLRYRHVGKRYGLVSESYGAN